MAGFLNHLNPYVGALITQNGASQWSRGISHCFSMASHMEDYTMQWTTGGGPTQNRYLVCHISWSLVNKIFCCLACCCQSYAMFENPNMEISYKIIILCSVNVIYYKVDTYVYTFVFTFYTNKCDASMLTNANNKLKGITQMHKITSATIWINIKQDCHRKEYVVLKEMATYSGTIFFIYSYEL